MRISDWSSDVCSSDLETTTQGRILGELADLFELEAPPRRIEVYDNSHIQGTNALGAMIVAGPEGFIKNAYRKFNIKRADTTQGDDFAMKSEVLVRRSLGRASCRERGVLYGDVSVAAAPLKKQT